MLLVSALFEPVRLAVQPLVGDAVGGVGGWAGLTNIGVPEDCRGARVEGWCFKPGVLAGLSPYGLAFVLAWTLPPLLAAAARAAAPAEEDEEEEEEEGEEEEEVEEEGEEMENGARRLGQLLRAWSALSCLWFLVPLASFATSPFYRTSVWTAALGLSLAAAYPLSWHLALVALPVSELVVPHLSLSDPAVKSFHKAVGWRTAGWAAMHGGLELLYLLSRGLPRYLNVARDSDDWIYVLGLASLVLVALHSILAWVRKHQWLRAHFRTIHRLTAILLLVCASAHWTPFALLLLPAAAAHGGGAVVRAARARGLQLTERRELLVMASALAGGLAGLSAVWVARERALSRPEADARLQLVFSPLALAAEALGGLGGAALALAVPPVRGAPPAGDQLLASCSRQSAP
ncbi:unnamed protein product [Prorocentrum cordatum]|uniref:Ferric oxidoreductase domain-containing protein n=1 Tax=Prorocentrum cordatum TaxID=2364126 RepID=A0ABN9V239_9DINO|nr:unnamed protein product [Polarella glacialis]